LLGIVVTDHATVLARAGAALARLARGSSQAHRAGDLGFLNREFRQRRLQAQAEGRPFPPYSAARARLQRALVAVAAGDRPGIVARVFGGEGALPPG
jgi:hypothetical protein